jgi:acyl-CoA hydrolase/GNAT superfamily N-acetyltransferase
MKDKPTPDYNENTVSAKTAIAKIKNGSRIFISSASGEPQHLIETMVHDPRIQDIMIYQMLAITLEKYLMDASFFNRFILKLFFVTNTMQEAAKAGKVDYVPAYLSEIPSLFSSNQISLDVALIQISPPDQFGYASLGVSVDITKEAARCAGMVIAQVNPKMPRTHGDGFIHINDIDYLVPYEEDLVELVPNQADKWITQRIARYIAELVDDGSTLQVGYGHVPYSLLQFLQDKNDLGIHTQMITDAFIPLFENGNITNKRKTLLKDRAVATYCMGTRKIFDYIDDNPVFYFRTADFVNNPSVIAQNDNFISICSAMQVDLTGQICTDSVRRYFFSGTGDQANFIRGATMSKGGFSIFALPSTAKNNTISRIVANLDEGAGLATLRADVNFVVTEYGIAQLKGKSIYQRVIELAQIAHPDFRQELIDKAKSNRYIFADQLPPSTKDLNFLEDYKSQTYLKNKKLMSIRPLLPSDEIAYRNFFYKLKKETVYLRFFQNINVFSHKMAQDHWSDLDYRNNISLICQVRNKGNKEIVAIGTYAGLKDAQAEVAFVVREDFQGLGIATYLLMKLEEIAKENGYKRFLATVLRKNKSMGHIFLKRYPSAIVNNSASDIEFIMDFNQTESV